MTIGQIIIILVMFLIMLTITYYTIAQVNTEIARCQANEPTYCKNASINQDGQEFCRECPCHCTEGWI